MAIADGLYMALSFDRIVGSGEHAVCAPDQALCRRIRAEFREMPGLTLTLPQAARLFSIDCARCQRVLTILVEEGYLVNNGTTFTNAGNGRRSA